MADTTTGTVVVALPTSSDPVNTIGDEQKHATLVYLGDEVSAARVEDVVDAVRMYVDDRLDEGTLGPFSERVRHVESLGDKGARVWMMSSADGLERIHHDLANIPVISNLMADAEQFPTYTPHMTIGYPPDGAGDLDKETEAAAAGVASISFDRIAVWSGAEQTEYSLSSPATTETASLEFASLSEEQQRALFGSISEVAGRELTPGDAASTEKLMRYWAEGEGAAKIGWGVAGDFARCETHLGKYVGPTVVKGLCANLHHRATGAWPGHAPTESAEEATMPEHLRLVENVTLTERAAQDASRTGRFLMQFISPGWGSSGYYSPEVLQEAAMDRVIPAGTHMYADHPTDAEAKARPGRSVKDLMAVTLSDARVSESGALVGEVQVVPGWQPFVESVRDHIGVSIRGDARDVREGVAEGRRGRIIEGLAHVHSVDFVTRAGRGGKVLELLESAIADGAEISEELTQAIAEDAPAPTDVPAARPDGTTTTETQETDMGQKSIEESEFTRLTEAAGRVDTLEAELKEVKAALAEATKPTLEGPVVTGPRAVVQKHIEEQAEAIARLEAREGARLVIDEVLAEAWLGDAQKARLTTALMESLPMKDGKLDEQALRDTATDRVNEAESETAEILSSAGVGSVRGLGGLTPTTEKAAESIESELIESFKARGLSEAAATAAVKGR